MRHAGLGRGLDALIPGAGPAGPQSALRDLPIDLVQANRFQPRAHFADDALAELTASVRALGVLQPVLVRAVDDHFELIAGERRWRAARAAGLHTIPALVRDIDDTTSLEHALVENLHREDLSPIEEAAAYAQLAAEFSITYDAIGTMVGKSRSAVANTVRLLQLPVEIQQMVNERVLSAGHARALLGLDDAGGRPLLVERIIAEDLSVRATEDAIRQLNAAAQAPADPGTASKPTIAARPAQVVDIEERLSTYLHTRVKVAVGGKERGKVTLDFAGFDDLERLCWAIVEATAKQDGSTDDHE